MPWPVTSPIVSISGRWKLKPIEIVAAGLVGGLAPAHDLEILDLGDFLRQQSFLNRFGDFELVLDLLLGGGRFGEISQIGLQSVLHVDKSPGEVADFVAVVAGQLLEVGLNGVVAGEVAAGPGIDFLC